MGSNLLGLLEMLLVLGVVLGIAVIELIAAREPRAKVKDSPPKSRGIGG